MPPSFFSTLKISPDVVVGDLAALAAGRDVGGEDLDRGVTFLDDLGDLPIEVVRDRPLQHDVIAVVGIAFAAPVLPADVDRLIDGLTVGPRGKIEERRGAAVDCGAADHVRAVCKAGLAAFLDRRDVSERVDMRVDPARDGGLAGGVDHACRLSVRELSGGWHGGDGLALDADIPGAGALRCDDLVTAND